MKSNDEEVKVKPELTTNNKMAFIRLTESTEQRDYCYEVEIASEVRISGNLTYGDSVIMRPLTHEPNRDDLYKYTLSISAPAAYKLPKYQSSKDGYYLPGGIEEEILSFASLHFRCRFFSIADTFRFMTGPAISKTEHDFAYIRPRRNVDNFLFDDKRRNFINLEGFLDKVRSLPEKLHHEFANAVRLYALAVKEIGSNDELAYIHLVSAIEILSKNYELESDQDPLLPEINRINDLLKDANKEAKTELLNLFKQRKSMMKFASFIQEHIKDTILKRPAAGDLKYKICEDNLLDALKKIYNARSKFLHEGSAMYMSIPGMSPTDYDYDISLGGTMDNRELDLKNKLPYISFFEGLVRECLLNYLDRNIPE